MLNILLCWKQNCQNWWIRTANLHEKNDKGCLLVTVEICAGLHEFNMEMLSFWSDRFLLLHNENNVCLYYKLLSVYNHKNKSKKENIW